MTILKSFRVGDRQFFLTECIDDDSRSVHELGPGGDVTVCKFDSSLGVTDADGKTIGHGSLSNGWYFRHAETGHECEPTAGDGWRSLMEAELTFARHLIETAAGQ